MMMKKTLVALAATTLIFAACEKTPDPVTVSLSSLTATESTLANSPKTVMVTISNTTDQSATIKWERSETTSPAGFTYMVNGSSDNASEIKLDGNETVEVKLMVNPNGNTGTATGTLSFYDKDNQSSTTQSFAYSVSTVSDLFVIQPVGPTSSSARAAGGADGQGGKDYYINVINPTQSTITVTWEKVETTLPTGWNIPICTDEACYSPSIFTQTMTMEPSDTVVYKATFTPSGNVGAGEMDAIFYVADDSAATHKNQILMHSVTQ